MECDAKRCFWEITRLITKNEDITILVGRASESFLDNYLQMADGDFYHPLSSRVCLTEYAGKLAALANSFVITVNGNVAGLVCAYLNDCITFRGFIPFVHVKKEYRGLHLSKELLNAVISICIENHFLTIGLEVSQQQTAAYSLYDSLGFVLLSRDDDGRCYMELQLP